MHSRRAIVARARPAGLELAGERLDVCTFHLEQSEVMVGAVGGVLAQIECVCLMGEAGVPGQESGEREPFRFGERVVVDERGRENGRGTCMTSSNRSDWKRCRPTDAQSPTAYSVRPKERARRR